MRKSVSFFFLFFLLFLTVFAVADAKKAGEKIDKASREASAGNMPGAEKLLREAVREDPNSVRAHLVLANTLSEMHKYGAATDEYTAALDLDKAQNKLSMEQKRIAMDQRAVATALGGNLAAAKQLLEGYIKEDPDYPLFYYNLACAHAELGDLEKALFNLKKGWELRQNVARGESFPDPRKDSSFKKYLNDEKFQDATRNMVF